MRKQAVQLLTHLLQNNPYNSSLPAEEIREQYEKEKAAMDELLPKDRDAQEAEKVLARIGDNDLVVALDEHGQQTSSIQLAERIKSWQMHRSGVVMVIGGANGLSESVLARANECISLSKLTLPHYLVRVVLAEALYRADSINSGHPYHRT